MKFFSHPKEDLELVAGLDSNTPEGCNFLRTLGIEVVSTVQIHKLSDSWEILELLSVWINSLKVFPNTGNSRCASVTKLL